VRGVEVSGVRSKRELLLNWFRVDGERSSSVVEGFINQRDIPKIKPKQVSKKLKRSVALSKTRNHNP